MDSTSEIQDTEAGKEITEASPYTSPIVLVIGSRQRKYTVPKAFLPDSLSSRAKAHKRITLSDIDDDIAHTFVHFLHTGKYQTTNARGMSLEASATREHRCSLLVYSVAKRYRMDELESVAQLEVGVQDSSLPISSVLDNLKATFSDLGVEDTWLEQYLQRKINDAKDADETFLSNPVLSDHFQTGFERTLFKSIAKLGNETENMLKTITANAKTIQTNSDISKPYQPRYSPKYLHDVEEESSRSSDTQKAVHKRPKPEDPVEDCEQRIPEHETSVSKHELATTKHYGCYNACLNIADEVSSVDDSSDGYVAIPTPTTEADRKSVPEDEILNEREPNGLDFSHHKGFPTFPILQTRGVVPICRRCRRPCVRKTVKRLENKNFGRPYYICLDCPAYGGISNHYGNYNRWTTWDDSIGIDLSNPECYCRLQSRQDRALDGSKRPGMGFWTCASGRCNYYSEFRSGRDDQEDHIGLEEVAFEPWLLGV